MAVDIDALVDELTLEEKIRLVHGESDPDGTATGYVPGIERLAIPPLRLVDGPLGVRAIGERATAFPASVALAAAWRPDLAAQFGRALARETAAHCQDVVLAPGVNIARVPQGGRNFEYYSEDPHLAARTAAGTVSGIEREGVGATVKHYVANNQETDRYEVSAEVSERALREVYLRPFRAAVESGATAVMTAYNRVNGTYMSDHEHLISEVLRDEWDFDGLVMSDWWGTRSTVAAAQAGLDLEMPGVRIEQFVPDETEIDLDAPGTPSVADEPPFFGERIRTAVESGTVEESLLDRKVERLLRTLDSLGRFEDRPDGSLDTPEHRDIAYEIATEGTVLLRNEGVLPLSDTESLALIGPNADSAKVGGGGSSEVTPFVERSPLEALRDRTDVTFERGVASIDESSIFADDSNEAARTEADLDAAVEAAADAAVAVVVVQDDASEFVDRASLALPGRQDELIEAVAAAADRTVVVLRTSSPVETPWIEAVDAVLETWYPGQADGDALADVLLGDAEPGGRLPVTFGYAADDYPTADKRAFPGVDKQAHYEGVFVGYRHFDREGIEPAFAFGHGLSYAKFAYGDPRVAHGDGALDLTVPVANVSGRAGKSVVQVYAHKAAAPIQTPDRELVGFQPVEIEAGGRREVTIQIAEDELAYYDEQSGWDVPRGKNELFVGHSSRSIEATLPVDL